MRTCFGIPTKSVRATDVNGASFRVERTFKREKKHSGDGTIQPFSQGCIDVATDSNT